MDFRIVVMIRTFAFLLLLICGGSCKESVEHKTSATKVLNATTYEKGSGLAVVSELAQVDSLQILYYDDPIGDSLRYSRYFSHTATNDTAVINLLLRNLDNPFDKRKEISDCRSEGKIFLFKKGDPLKTVYFSTNCHTCCHLYFIHNGEFIYFAIDLVLIDTLRRSKPDKSSLLHRFFTITT